jgi:starch phosphorylase
MEFRPFQELLPRHVEITRMIDEEVILERHGDFVSDQFFSSVMFSYLPCVIQLIHAIVVESGAEDLNLLRQKLKQMRIFYNIGLPESVLELLVKLESSVADSIEEVEVSDEETESTDEEQSEQ